MRQTGRCKAPLAPITRSPACCRRPAARLPSVLPFTTRGGAPRQGLCFAPHCMRGHASAAAVWTCSRPQAARHLGANQPCHATLSSLAPAGGTRWRAPASRRGPATQSCGMARSRSMCWTTSAQASHRLSAPQAAPPAPLVSGGGGRTEWGPELPQRRPCSQAQPHSLGCVDHAHPCLPAPSFAAAPLCSGLSQLFCAFCDPAGGRPTLCVAKGGVACRHVVNVSCAGGCPVAA